MKNGEASKHQVFSRLFVEGGVTGGTLEKAVPHFAVFINANAKLRGLGRFVAGCSEFRFRSLRGTQRVEFRRKADRGRDDFRDGLDLRRGQFDGSGRTRAGDAQRRRSRRQVPERRLVGEIRRGVLDRGHDERFSIRERLRGGSQRRIFGVQPAKEEAALVRVRRDQAHATRWRQKRDCRRIHDLKNVEAEGVKGQGSEKKSRDDPFTASWPFPTKDQIVGRRGGKIHFEGVVARATDVIPCSSARLVTSTTRA